MRPARLALVAALLVLAASCGGTSAADEPVVLVAQLRGAEIVPPAGDSDGAATLRYVIDHDEVCVTGRVTGVEGISDGHIHRGARGKFGKVVVHYELSLSGAGPFTIDECTDVDPAVAADIVRDPSGFYASFHSLGYPQGAVRGQLTRPAS